MTEFVREALVQTGIAMDQFDESAPMPQEQETIDAAAFLEKKLAEKYPNDTFSLITFNRHSVDQAYDEFILAPLGDADKQFTAIVQGDSEGLFARDGYYGVVRNADYEQYLTDLFSSVEPEVQVIATISCLLPDDVTLDAPIDQVASRTDFLAYVWLLCPPGEEGSFAARDEALWACVLRDDLHGSFTMFEMLPETTGLAREEALARIPQHTDAAPVYSERDRHARR